ncbi:PTS system mannose/fructose/sorbose family transporter subunit IID [Pseudolactococcus carnosus]|uniref:PTS system mannose/fructose/sorbose family transporter subunit IID n=1 Tax=Pseudolactococcus carnosus TaxID=2749961 RepID=UPI00081225C3|nr:PTS system mannose/fructose/sorbose family transporter subunit IID [Lactococcus carnosus]SCA92312.1 PTS system mannose-specific IID component [Lactococcus piscium]MCJ1968527.1 PTS system mannose/fructose/sorbose family transporter subunit IID [Lactococcus carnosus]MCJ1974438.1 PTS system mannose/fructose/sorbose family transporter subunit IID [Lactococcus carnosus]MCJ1982225.1 PTS system mannose/fructose/sorbose family transporter subunit IID [Lactococcus carnosus]MCJ1984745.1 PTS system ma
MAITYKSLPKAEKKLIKSMYWRSFTLYSAVTPAKQGASGVSYTMQPFIDRFYKNREADRKAAMVRHMSYFNTNVAMFPFIMGITASMEKENAEKDDFNPESINAIKTSLIGPLAGIGDSVFWGVLRVIAAGIGVSLAQANNFMAPLIFLLLFNLPVQLVRWQGAKLGYTLGASYISDLYESGMINVLTKGATIVGLAMVGAMTSNMVSLQLKWNMVLDGKTIMKSQEMLNQIFVGLIPLSITLICFWLLKKKNMSINILIFSIIGLGILLSVLGIA